MNDNVPPCLAYKIIYPIKFITTKCNTMCPKMKSANPRSGEIPMKICLFWEFDWRRRQTEIKQKVFQNV